MTVSWVAVAAVTVAATPPNETALSAAVVEKLVPVTLTVPPTTTDLKSIDVAVGVETFVNGVEDATSRPLSVTSSTPEVVLVIPDGTVTVSCVLVAAVTVPGVPSKSTTLLAAVELKLVPVMVTVAP